MSQTPRAASARQTTHADAEEFLKKNACGVKAFNSVNNEYTS
jgi:hypothetical protein